MTTLVIMTLVIAAVVIKTLKITTLVIQTVVMKGNSHKYFLTTTIFIRFIRILVLNTEVKS